METEKLENNTTYGFSIFIRIVLLGLSISFIRPGIEYLFMSKEINISKILIFFWIFFYFIDKINVVYQHKLYGTWWLQRWVLIEKKKGKSFTSRILAFISSILIFFNSIFCFLYLSGGKFLFSLCIYILVSLLWFNVGKYLALSAFFYKGKDRYPNHKF